jgi:peptidoglycan/xylan/chitin deacetylase (PgdA/CDA1 family)
VKEDLDERHYLEERYRAGGANRSLGLAAYYAVKPLLPRRLQIALRRIYARRQAGVDFPRWPVEPLLVESGRAARRAELDRRGADRLAQVAAWPRGYRFAAVLTHDVEGPAGLHNLPQVLEIERRHGVVSSWNFVAEDYTIDGGLFEEVVAAGCEVGLHGVSHDCSLFESRSSFEEQLPKIHRYLARWEVDGFRSPATHRNPDWMPEIRAAYDSSFPDTDPFEPQPGGCCSIFPFFLGDLVELPITLVQDHTLWEILRRDEIGLWTEKADWIIENGGLVNLITHPDYLDRPSRLRMYEEFIEYLTSQEGGWLALPREVARWWRTKSSLVCVEDDRGVHVEGEGADLAAVQWVQRSGDGVRYELEPVPA